MTEEQVVAVEEGVWRRLNPLSPVIRGGRALIGLAVVFVPSTLAGGGGSTHSLIDLGVAVVLVGLGVVSWLVTRWRVEGGDLRIETGLLRRKSSRFPLQADPGDRRRPADPRAHLRPGRAAAADGVDQRLRPARLHEHPRGGGSARPAARARPRRRAGRAGRGADRRARARSGCRRRGCSRRSCSRVRA